MRSWHAILAVLLVPFMMAQTIPYQGPSNSYSVDNPLPAMTMPFARLHRDPIRLKDIGPTPKTFPVTLPAGATTYRVAIPCDVDVRLLGTNDPTEQVTEDKGMIYLARTEATMGTSHPTFISAMTMGTPGYTCTPEMHYGRSGG
ncbi:hypothetical protein [Methylobacterium sp. PvR107]|uniref:hypothetical protein n=1 Tax=Methylobacterium sp. PvR107 TaxID=2806597 RepID=UPI001AE1459B|nr:hypothetical protein [Methylobacterium sp. PvR107]MBP1179978.1 hypothetical protein [Methylobacterium sp. PvR107]